VSDLRAVAPAKVNLALAVTGVRDDGYHLLRSVFLRLQLHDELEVALGPEGTPDTLEIDGDLEAAGDNLVLRASAYLRELLDAPLPALRFRLRKRVPVAAGLAGGSSDAATALDLSLAAWGLRLHPAERLEAALRLGADVPFFAAGHAAALVEGIGEHLVSLPGVEPPAGVVLVTPRERLATTAVFAELDREADHGATAAARVDEVADLLREGVDGMTLAAASSMLRDANDLWAPAIRLSPALAATREVVSASLGHPLMLTGSGPTLYAVYPSEAAAGMASAALLAARHPQLEGATIITTSTAPGGGS
jgi:4-diphosphocytidyl-2-C-methyl-D-erythritol kinase